MENQSHTHAGTVRCPQCSHEFAITEGILSEFKDGLNREFELERTKMLKTVSDRETELARKSEEVSSREATIGRLVEDGVADKLKAVRKEEGLKAAQEAAREMEDLKARVVESAEALRIANENELSLRKQKRELEAAKENLDLEVARKLDAERKTIREEVTKKADEENQFRLAEKDEKIAGMSRKIDELKRKAEQGSVQLQGEVMEMCLEAELTATFVGDLIVPVPKGMRGADVIQTVVSPSGRECGAIIYETKRTKAWQPCWILKLKEDQLAAQAQIPVIVTEVLPTGMKGFGLHEGVWVTDYANAIPLAAALRFALVELSREQIANEGRTGKAEVLYSYITGNDFRQRIESIVDLFSQMKTDLDKERRCAAKTFKKREVQILMIQTNIASMFGSMEAIAGKALPAVMALEMGEEQEAA